MSQAAATRARDLLIGQRTALINALRGHFAELGIVVAQGARNTRQLIAYLQEETNPDLPDTARIALQPLAAMLMEIEAQIARLDKAILAAHRSDPVSTRLAGIPGISIPCGFTKAGLPIGLQLLGPAYSEEKLLRTARQYERETQWHRQRPNL